MVTYVGMDCQYILYKNPGFGIDCFINGDCVERMGRMIVFISGLAGFALGAVAGMVLTCLMQVRR